METKTPKPPKAVKAQRKKTIAMLERLKLTDADFEWRRGVSCVDDAMLNTPIRIQVLHCNNATMLNRVYSIRTVTPFALLGRDVLNRAMHEIDTQHLDFRVL
jgi:hypothetical protein